MTRSASRRHVDGPKLPSRSPKLRPGVSTFGSRCEVASVARFSPSRIGMAPTNMVVEHHAWYRQSSPAIVLTGDNFVEASKVFTRYGSALWAAAVNSLLRVEGGHIVLTHYSGMTPTHNCRDAGRCCSELDPKVLGCHLTTPVRRIFEAVLLKRPRTQPCNCCFASPRDPNPQSVAAVVDHKAGATQQLAVLGCGRGRDRAGGQGSGRSRLRAGRVEEAGLPAAEGEGGFEYMMGGGRPHRQMRMYV